MHKALKEEWGGGGASSETSKLIQQVYIFSYWIRLFIHLGSEFVNWLPPPVMLRKFHICT